MIVHNLYIESITFLPSKTDAVLLVDANAVLPGTIAMQSFQMVTRRYPKVLKHNRRIQDRELPECAALKGGW